MSAQCWGESDDISKKIESEQSIMISQRLEDIITGSSFAKNNNKSIPITIHNIIMRSQRLEDIITGSSFTGGPRYCLAMQPREG